MSKTPETIQFNISDNNEGTRLDLVLSAGLEDYSRSFIQKLFEGGLIQVNGEECREKKRKCKVGDVVYQVTRNFISEFRVRFVEIATCGNLFLHTDLISGIVYTGDVFSESDIGKTVFLTREEAEAALKERESE